MNFQQIGYVLAVCEQKNFYNAAEKCNITQSTLSAMILKLEDELGITIFDRKTKPVTITKEGQLVIEKMKLVLKEINDLKELVKELKGDDSGELKIGVIPTIAPFVLPLFLCEFSKKHPLISLEIEEKVTETLKRELLNRTLDIGLLSLPIQHPDLIEIPLYDEEYMLYDHTSGPFNHGGKPVLKDINKQKLWLMAEGHCMRTQVEDLCTIKKGLKEWDNLNYQTGSIDTLIRLVKKSKGLTLLPKLSTVDLSGEERDHVFTFSDPIPKRKIGLVIHKHFVKQKLLRLIQNEITEAVREHL